MCGTDFTSAKKKRFIKKLRETGSITKSAEYAGISRPTPYHHRDPDNPCYDAEFHAAWKDALERYAEKLEAEADRRAVEGVRKLKFDRNGDALKEPETGEYYEEREYSDTLLIFRLKALKPGKYRENQSIEHSGAVSISFGGEVDLKDEDPPA